MPTLARLVARVCCRSTEQSEIPMEKLSVSVAEDALLLQRMFKMEQHLLFALQTFLQRMRNGF